MAPLSRDLIHHVLPRAEVNIITSLRSLINYRSVMVIWLTSPVIYRRVKLPENTVSYGPLTGPVTNPYIGRPRLLSKRSRNSPKKNPFSAIGVRALPHHRIKPVLIRKPSFMDRSDWPGMLFITMIRSIPSQSSRSEMREDLHFDSIEDENCFLVQSRLIRSSIFYPQWNVFSRWRCEGEVCRLVSSD